MLLSSARLGLPAVLIAVVFTTPAFAQKGGNNGGNSGNNMNQPHIPKPEEIQAAAKDILSKCETQTAELEGMAKLTYKAIPSSMDEILKQVGEKYAGQVPKGYDVDALLKQFGPQITDAMNAYLTEPDGWSFVAAENLKWKSKKIPKGEYKVSLVVDGESLLKLVLSQPESKDEKGKTIKAVQIPINFSAVKKQQDPFPKLRFDLVAVQDKKTKDTNGFEIKTEFFRTSSHTGDPVKLDPPKDAPKKSSDDTAKKDDSGSAGGGSNNGNGGSGK
jgi:hypothetical protein